jgi:hypothetical protein
MAGRSRRTWLPPLAALVLGAGVLVALFLRPEGASTLTGVELAYAIAGDGTAYRSTDFGATWTPVAAAPRVTRS